MTSPLPVLVTGSRTWRHYLTVASTLAALRAEHGPLTVMHGHCRRGADAHADNWCTRTGTAVLRRPADWTTYGRRAGYVRNAAMVATGPAVCVAFIRGGSAGASHCAALATRAGIPVLLFEDSA